MALRTRSSNRRIIVGMTAKLLTRDGELVTEFGMPRFRITPPGATAYSFCEPFAQEVRIPAKPA
jgi:hypothetical protein